LTTFKKILLSYTSEFQHVLNFIDQHVVSRCHSSEKQIIQIILLSTASVSAFCY